MRIGVYHPALDMYGGAEVVAVATVNALAQNGYDVVLYVNRRIDQKRVTEMLGEPLSSKTEVIVDPTFLQPRGPFHLYESAVRSLKFSSKCDVLVDTYSCYIFPWTDVSYVHFPYLNNYEFRAKFPYLKKAHLQDVLTLPYAVFEKNLENYDKKLIVSNSHFTSRAIKESLGAESEVLYPPIHSSLFERDATESELLRENLVVTIARFGRGKGVELVPEIAYLTDDSVKFVLIGLAHDSNVVQAVKKRIRDLGLEQRVIVKTNAARKEIKSLLANSKVYLHTTKMEHFGISIAEAMAMGCLPVVHNSGGAPEFVPDQYRYNDLQEAACEIERAICQWNNETSRSMIEIAERFSGKNFAKRFIELFIGYCTSIEQQ